MLSTRKSTWGTYPSTTLRVRWSLAANAQIAVITGMFAMANYNWRSMVSPGITGLFNANCLKSGDNNLMTCYPGDNTYDGVNTDVSLVSTISPYHSIYTTESTNGEDDPLPFWVLPLREGCWLLFFSRVVGHPHPCPPSMH